MGAHNPAHVAVAGTHLAAAAVVVVAAVADMGHIGYSRRPAVASCNADPWGRIREVSALTTRRNTKGT